MIVKPKMYDEIKINQDYEKIELGGHKGIIMGAEEYTSEQSSKTSLKVSIDTTKDDKQPEYFTEQYRNDTRIDRRWSNSAIKYVSLGGEETQVRQLKAFITAYENSNNCEFDWSKDWEQLKGKKIGLVFAPEQYQKQDGNIGLAHKLREFRSIDKVDNIKIPKVKLLDGTYVDYEEYIKGNNSSTSSDEIEITGDMLPF